MVSFEHYKSQEYPTIAGYAAPQAGGRRQDLLSGVQVFLLLKSDSKTLTVLTTAGERCEIKHSNFDLHHVFDVDGAQKLSWRVDEQGKLTAKDIDGRETVLGVWNPQLSGSSWRT